ncbi:F0F1 ATP synthase subunit delta [Heyndrickxia acidiproducens]|uniref:F0F1 ATP synthase subunit delta n=1 Tax=Heyndrickxia acidiproducens TaxID=1121084 RepID=UPI00037D4D97|nr:F0F1 ATP synthase subunit delta [Heyndrickxia acidiproducens]
MSNEAVENRYALALFELAKEHQQLETIEKEIKVVKQVLENNIQFLKLLKSPKMKLEAKRDMVKETFSGLSNYTLNTLLLLLDRHRSDLIVNVCRSFIELVNNERGVADAVVYSARTLTAEENAAISKVFAKRVGKQSLNIENIVDSDLLGGLKIRIGNSIFDSSLRGKLERLERTLIS